MRSSSAMLVCSRLGLWCTRALTSRRWRSANRTKEGWLSAVGDAAAALQEGRRIQSISQPISRSCNQSINQSINQSVSQPRSKLARCVQSQREA